tara:strand:- start:3037 stop:3486 length:450 start_codon:yes stop_codon:yes gene_type:complete
MKKTTLILLLSVIVQFGFGQIKPNKNWTAFLKYEGVDVEYKYAPCNTNKVNNQILVLFRFINASSDKVTLSWGEERWVNNICSNCNSVASQEKTKRITLEPYQTIEGDCSSKEFKERYIFSQFIELVPGMSKSSLTDFKFRNISIKRHQ